MRNHLTKVDRLQPQRSPFAMVPDRRSSMHVPVPLPPLRTMNFAQDASGTTTASQPGLAINHRDRIYRNGSAVFFEQKVMVAVEYLKAKNDVNDTRPNISALSRKWHVSRSSVTKKVEEELISFVWVIDPKDIVGNRDIPSGPGSKSLSDLDVPVVLLLYHREPSRPRIKYNRRV